MSCPLKALAAPPRRAILRALRAGALPAGDLGTLAAVPGESLVEHVRVLQRAGLLREQRSGGAPSYRLERERVHELAARLRAVAEA